MLKHKDEQEVYASNGNRKFLQWLCGILLALLTLLSGFFGGRYSISSAVSDNRLTIREHTIQIQEIQRGIMEIKQGQIDMNKKLDMLMMRKEK